MGSFLNIIQSTLFMNATQKVKAFVHQPKKTNVVQTFDLGL